MGILMDGNLPELKKGSRVAQEEPVVYEREIENLPTKICDKYYELLELVDKLHKANTEDEAAVKALNSYIDNQEEAYGSLGERVRKKKERRKKEERKKKEERGKKKNKEERR